MLTFDITTTALQVRDQQPIVINKEYTAKDKRSALVGFTSYIENNKNLELIKNQQVFINLLNEVK